MELRETNRADVTVEAENIGGIERTSVTLSPGVTVLVGRNATNRTSFLQAIMAAAGSDRVAIKSDADEARVGLRIGDETYTRELRRRSGTVVTDGEPYLDDPELADLFAFVLESNEARQAVARGDDLRELIMRPVDTEEIRTRVERLLAERESLTEELEAIDERKRDLPELERERTSLRDRIEETRAELEAAEADLEATDTDLEEARTERDELGEKLETLRDRRSELDDVRYEMETERESLDALEREKRELEAELAEMPETPAGEADEVEDRIGRLRDRKRALEREVNDLQSVIGFNEDVLEDADSDAFAALSGEDESVTDRLVADDEVTCWTCGSTVDREQVETTIDRLRELAQAKLGEVSDLDDEIAELNDRRQELERARREREQLDRRTDELADEIERTRGNLDRLADRREALTDEIAAIESAVEDLESEDDSTVLELHKEANQYEYELGRLETELERVEAEIEEIEARVDERDEIEAQREEVDAEIEELRTRIDRIEASAIEEFNEHMDTVLEMLDYANLDRIWLERVRREVREGRRTVTETAFELHVVRSTASGTAYEDTVDHLSESEREVTGLVFALAGYLAHEVYETVPFMLLDSLEAIDADRIAALVDYFDEYPGYLVVALLPEDAQALRDEYERITDI